MTSQPLPYQDPALATGERVRDLLGRMTLEEKVGQMMQMSAREGIREWIEDYQCGSLLYCFGPQATEAIEMAARTRLGIPLLLGQDGIHGHSFWPGAAIFPTQLAMACSWNTELLERVARVTAVEMSCTGPKWTFSPVLCLTRDLRWGRVGETFGEDPFLIGEFAQAMIKGYQGEGLNDPTAVLATAKHYAGYSETQGGRDASEADLSRRKLRSYFLPPFEQAVRAGCMAFMTGYQSMDGLPSTANRWLLREVLKEEWGFTGLLVTDWNNVGRMVEEQKICATYAEAAVRAIRAGNDMIMVTPAFRQGALDAVDQGALAEGEIDEVCGRILALKFKMGLFENPCSPDSQRQALVINCTEHQQVNLEAARQSIVLLKNEGDFLPLTRGGRRTLAVIGPNADDPLAQLGDWSLGSGQMEGKGGEHPRACTTTLLDGLRALAPQGWEIAYEKGCNILDEDQTGMPGALELARRADVVVAVVGDRPELIGETKSTATLELQGGQIALLEALARIGVPTVLVLINSKPMVLPPSARGAVAIVEAFNPGMKGGQALAEILFGDVNPCGKLTISIPYHVGQQPVFYSQVRGQHGDRYADLTQEPMFSFGQGLSYTRFEYSNLRVLTPQVAPGQRAVFEVDVTNTGARKGTEIVQLYVSDLVTSVTWVEKALKAYRRVELEPGEKQTVRFELGTEVLGLVNESGQYIVERGEFGVMIGASSRACDQLSGTFLLGA